MTQDQQFTEWMAQYERMVRHIIVGFEAKPALQDELFQDIALNIWKAVPSFKGNSSVKTFVARIAQNVLANHVAKATRTIKSVEIDEETDEPDSDSTPYASLEKSQRQKRLNQAIRQLGFEQKQIITLALEGLSYQEMAEILDITTNLVGVRLQRAKSSLMKLLEA